MRSAAMLSCSSATSCQLRTTSRLVAIRKIIVTTIIMSVNEGQKLFSPPMPAWLPPICGKLVSI
jgi:hypothetical protein